MRFCRVGLRAPTTKILGPALAASLYFHKTTTMLTSKETKKNKAQQYMFSAGSCVRLQAFDQVKRAQDREEKHSALHSTYER